MKNSDLSTADRRRFLKLVGGGAVMLPLAALTACSGDKSPPAGESAPATDTAPKPAPTEETASGMANETAADTPPAQDGMPRLSEDDPQAKTLGYVHEASSVDQAKYPRFQAGQACSNCALYLGAADSEWGGCSIFPGKAVKATGWCNVYAPKA